ncbi:hypothetical protein CALVIDRAFT_542448 [Calocera viscosa TUFC12733]|uniref:Ribosomal RNA-processing protein 8 n=1 Tax=Calocera viscosa (strain TUFC12733) TaxID=1330018 RepID=A0A167GLS3_CALVF|nr:hypothetical protein CALVIDRAFT_542448 [Calocera viscosa TUFC12733]
MSLLFPTSWDGPSSSSAPALAAAQGKKRKRPSTVQKEDDIDLKSVEINIEKLMKKMQQEDVKGAKEQKAKEEGGKIKGKTGGKEKSVLEKGKAQGAQKGSAGHPNGKQAGRQEKEKPLQRSQPTSIPPKSQTLNDVETQGGKNKKRKRGQSDANQHVDTSPPLKAQPGEPVKPADDAPKMSKKEMKKARLSNPAPPTTVPLPPAAPSMPDTKLTPLQAKMKASLSGARFRWINEQLYTTSASHAHELMRAQPGLYSDYHAGFASQLAGWPTPPLEALAHLLQALPKHALIADLGSGPGTLARKLVPRGRKVLSFDLQADEWVTEADFCERIPLPGAEGERSEGAVVDAAVCCLSLMGTDWVRGVREARRVLVAKGQLFVAEVTSRFTSVDTFVQVVESVGFSLQKQEDKDTHFMLFVFQKVEGEALGDAEWEGILEKAEGLLKPCEYKRR